MKHKLVFVLALAAFSTQALSALDWTLQNRFGGDPDYIADEDFVTFEKDGDHYDTDGVEASDRLQFDFSSAKLQGRIRIHYQARNQRGYLGNNYTSDMRFRGYLQFNPIEYVGLVAGSEYWDKYVIAAGVLWATGDSRDMTKMAKHGFSIIGEFAGLKLLANFALPVSDFSSYNGADLNFGFDYNCFDMFTIGATFRDVLDNFAATVYAGLTMVDNLVLNLGFQYNALGSEYLRADSAYTYEYDASAETSARAGTDFLLSLSTGYKFTGIGLGIYADFASGLNAKYTVQDSETGHISHGTHEDNAIPMYAVGKVSYDLGESIALNFSATFYIMAGAEGTWNALEQMNFSPSVAYTLPDDWGVLRAGVRFKVADGVLAKFSIPIMWEYNIKSK